MFSDVLPNEVAWRIWDIYLLKGEVFVYQTALGILKYKKNELLGVRQFIVFANEYIEFG